MRRIPPIILWTLFIVIPTGCSSLLYHPARNQIFSPEKGGFHYEDVSFKTADSSILHGWYFNSTAPGPARGLLIFFHGNGENLSSHFISLLWILEKGYDFFIFDYRGYGLSEGKPSPQGTVEDGIAAIRLASQRAQKKKLPLVVFSQSLGGAVALRSLIELKNEIKPKLVVVDSSFLSYKAAGRSVLSHHWLTWIFQPLASLFLSDEWSPKNRISELAGIPMLVMHGERDQIIDYSLGVELFEKAKEPKEFVTVKNGRHTDAFFRSGDTYQRRLLSKLEEVLGSVTKLSREE